MIQGLMGKAGCFFREKFFIVFNNGLGENPRANLLGQT